MLFQNLIFEEREVIRRYIKPTNVVMAKTKPLEKAQEQVRQDLTTPRFNTMQKRPIDDQRTQKEQFKTLEVRRAELKNLQARNTVAKPAKR